MDIELVSQGFTSERQANDWCEEMAWEHAKVLTVSEGLSFGSEEFEQYYHTYRDRYRRCADNIGFLHHLAAQALVEIMECGVNTSAPKNATHAQLSTQFASVVAVILSAIAWASVSDEAWIPNEEFNARPEEERRITFTIYKEESSEDQND